MSNDEAHNVLGTDAVKSFIKSRDLNIPGVYKMMDEKRQIIYIGKALNLKNRLTNYTNLANLNSKTAQMVQKIRSIEVVVAKSELEAVVMEASLIHSFQPKYNILLKDGRSFAFIAFSTSDKFPRVYKHRGKKEAESSYFGPFVSTKELYDGVSLIKKLFKIRTCSDADFAKRSRPCMEYQIKRCSAPCVGYISQEEYDKSVKDALHFMHNDFDKVKEKMIAEMEKASEEMNYEKAASLRDKIRFVNSIHVSNSNKIDIDEADVFAIVESYGKICVNVVFIRDGKNYGSKNYFPKNTDLLADLLADPSVGPATDHLTDHSSESSGLGLSEILEQFILQFYISNSRKGAAGVPKLILINVALKNQSILKSAINALSEFKFKAEVSFPRRGSLVNLLKLGENNAHFECGQIAQSLEKNNETFKALKNFFHLTKAPSRIEVYDNSHTFGTSAVGSYIVYTDQGFMKSDYRRYNIDSKELTPGDDYGMLRQVLRRRFEKLGSELEPQKHPDLLLIDGGIGHMRATKEVMDEFGVEIDFICISKGPDRNAGNEEFHCKHAAHLKVPESQKSLLFFLQNIRDEAHSFAITSHRKKRQTNFMMSDLDNVPHIGLKRKKMLLSHFGSIAAIKKVSLEDLTRVPQMSSKAAKSLYNHLHSL